MSDPIQEGQAFAAAVFGRGPVQEPEPPTEPDPAEQKAEPEPVEDALITALRVGKPWQAELVRLMHPPEKEES